MRKYRLALILAFLPCVLPRLVHLVPRIHMNDFEVYYSAATLVRQHQGALIYKGADSGSDVKLLDWAPAETPIAIAARQAGLQQVRLYVYPPILADLLVPLSAAPLPLAKVLWTAMNLTSMLLIIYMLAQLMHIKPFGRGALLLLAGFIFSAPVYSCLFWGQVTLLLSLCWMFGIYAYTKGWRAASAIVFALAVAIKLTPVIILAPLIIWKDWRWLRNFAAFLLFFVLVMTTVSSPYSLEDYFFHVMPAMSRGLPEFSNHTLAAAVQYLYVALHGGSLLPLVLAIPDGVIKIGKGISIAAVLVIVVVPLYRLRNTMSHYDRVIALALVAMVSPAVAPVSWIHAYAVCYPALALLWFEAFTHRVSNGKLALLTGCSIILNSIAMTDIIEGLVHTGSNRVLASLMMFVTPLAALLLAYSRFGEMNEPRTMTFASKPDVHLPSAA